MLGAAQANASRAQRIGGRRLVRQVRIGADAEAAHPIGPPEQPGEALIDVRAIRREAASEHLEDLARLRRHLTDLHLAGSAIERDEVTLSNRATPHRHSALGLLDLELAGSHDGRLAHLATDHGRV